MKDQKLSPRNYYNIINTLISCVKMYEENLNNKKILIVSENIKTKKISNLSVLFSSENFQHLTGCYEKNNNNIVSAKNFYKHLLTRQINWNNLYINNSFVKEKMKVLPEIMKIDTTINMLGDYNGIGQINLETDKLAGNVTACLGISIAKENNNIYIPVSTLKKDIRDGIYNKEKVLAVFKKNRDEDLYSCITYLKKNYDIEKIFYNKEIRKLIDIENLYSPNKILNEKIVKYFIENVEIEENNKFNLTEDDDEEEM